MVEHCQMQMNLHDLGNEFLKDHECSYFFYIGTPTFFVFLGGPRHGEHGATVEKIQKVDII